MTGYQIISLITSTLMPIAIVVLGYWFNRRLKEIDHQNERRNQLFQEEKEQHRVETEKKEKERREELERRYEPHIEFTMDANFFGPQKGKYAAEFIIHAHNKSLIRHEFKKIRFQVRGIKKDEELMIWDKHPPILRFPHKIIDPDETDIVPKDWNYIFVEPGVKQQIDFVTPIDADYAYIVARAEFRYDKHTPHAIERVFAVTDMKQSICND